MHRTKLNLGLYIDIFKTMDLTKSGRQFSSKFRMGFWVVGTKIYAAFQIENSCSDVGDGMISFEPLSSFRFVNTRIRIIFQMKAPGSIKRNIPKRTGLKLDDRFEENNLWTFLSGGGNPPRTRGTFLERPPYFSYNHRSSTIDFCVNSCNWSYLRLLASIP